MSEARACGGHFWNDYFRACTKIKSKTKKKKKIHNKKPSATQSVPAGRADHRLLAPPTGRCYLLCFSTLTVPTGCVLLSYEMLSSIPMNLSINDCAVNVYFAFVVCSYSYAIHTSLTILRDSNNNCDGH